MAKKKGTPVVAFRRWVDKQAQTAGVSPRQYMEHLAATQIVSLPTLIRAYARQPFRTLATAEKVSAMTGLTVRALMGLT